jgi:hypothetical protein
MTAGAALADGRTIKANDSQTQEKNIKRKRRCGMLP